MSVHTPQPLATIEIDPVRTLLVIGPQLTSMCISESKRIPNNSPLFEPHHIFLSYKALAESGIRKSLELQYANQNEHARERRETLLWNAYELDPPFAMSKVTAKLHEHNGYQRWLEEVFAPCKEPLEFESSHTLQHLVSLRRSGVRLLYTHYDDTLARAMGLPVVLPEDGEDEVRKWAQGFPALLHLHGVHTRPSTVKIDCISYKTEVGFGRVGDIIREQFQSRMPLFIGFDSNHFLDPFLSKIVSAFATMSVMPTSLPLLLSLSRNQLSVPDVLPMAVEPSTSLRSLVTISKTHFSIATISDSSHPVSLQVVCTSKEEVSEISKLLHQFSNVLVNLTQRGDNDFVIDLQTNRQVLLKFWLQVFSLLVISKLEGITSIEVQGSFLVNFNPQKDESFHCFASQTVFATCHSKFGHSKFNRRNQDIMLISDQQNQQLIQQTDEHTQPKNSLLVYQQSAPTFPLCNPVLSARTGKLVSSAPFSSAPFSTAQIAVSRTHRQTLPIVIPGKIGERNSFEMKKEEFICEALEWSKQVSTKIKGSGSDSSSTSRTDVHVQPPPQSRSISSCLPFMPSSHLLPQSPPTTTPLHKPLPSSQTNGLSCSILAPPNFLTSSKISSPTSIHNGLLTTPTLQSGTKVVHMMQDGKKFANTSYSLDGEESERAWSNQSPKRVTSQSSDPESTHSPKKIRRSSSLPDVNQLKSSLPSSPVSTSPVSTVTPVSGLPEQTFASLMSNSGGGLTGQAIPPIFFSTAMGNSIKMEANSLETDSKAKHALPSPDINALNPVPPSRGPIQLWQFLLDLLISPDKTHLIHWTGNGYEFCIAQPEEVAKLWGSRKNKPRMNYDKLSRGIRYYYSKGIMESVYGKKSTFKYTCDIQQYIIAKDHYFC